MHNTSDLIEAYLKQLLAEAEEIEIKRSEIAERFAVVPSQINYVIKTRFNTINGFEVESKRGGGGYIKIVKFQHSTKHDLLSELFRELPIALSKQQTKEILQLLHDENMMTINEGNLLLTILTSELMDSSMRGQLVREILQKLDRMN